jgi:hypothetical protein
MGRSYSTAGVETSQRESISARHPGGCCHLTRDGGRDVLGQEGNSTRWQRLHRWKDALVDHDAGIVSRREIRSPCGGSSRPGSSVVRRRNCRMSMPVTSFISIIAKLLPMQ